MGKKIITILRSKLGLSRPFFGLNEDKRISEDYKSSTLAGLQIYGGPGTLSHDFKIWPITFQGSGPILFKF